MGDANRDTEFGGSSTCVLTQEVWGGTQELAFLTRSPETLTLPVQGPYCQNGACGVRAQGGPGDAHSHRAVAAHRVIRHARLSLGASQVSVKRLWELSPRAPLGGQNSPPGLTQPRKQRRTRAEVGHGDLWPGLECRLCLLPPVTREKLTHLRETRLPPP